MRGSSSVPRPPGWQAWKSIRGQARNADHAGGDADDLLIVYTSGTTGRPKGAVLTPNALLWNGYNSIHARDLHQRDHVLSTLPMFHVGGLNNQTLPALLAGASVTLHRRFEPGLDMRAQRDARLLERSGSDARRV